jgi:predicted Zn-dependent protease
MGIPAQITQGAPLIALFAMSGCMHCHNFRWQVPGKIEVCPGAGFPIHSSCPEDISLALSLALNPALNLMIPSSLPSLSWFNRIFLSALYLVLIAGTLQGQNATTAPWEAAAFSTDPKDIATAAAAIKAKKFANATVLYEERHVVFDAADRTTATIRIVYRVETKDALRDWGTARATWSPWRQKRPEIRARVIAPDGTVALFDPKILTESPAHDQRPEIYEDQRVYSGPLPGVEIGSIVEKETTWEDTAPITSHGVMRRSYVGYTEPLLHTVLELKAPSSVHLQYKVRKVPNVKVTRSEENGVVTLRFEQGEMDALERAERDLPSDFDQWPSIDYATGESWSAVAEGYYKDIESAIRPAEVSALLQGTAGLKGPELMRRVVSNVHQKVRYTGLEYGSSALIPHPAGDTLKSGYGDCKDKAIVVVSALKAVGIPAQLALLSTRGDSDVSPELAGLGIFDHAIVYIPGNAGTPGTWIDATAEYFEPGYLPWPDQGRFALLVGSNSKESKLVRTPINTPAENAQTVRREVNLSEYGPARFVEVFRAVGQESAILRNNYGQEENQETREGLERYVKTAFLAEALTNVEHSSGSDLTKPFELKLEMAKARRGLSDLTSAVVAIRPDALLWGYPEYVLSDDGTDKPDNPGWKPRQNDIELQPFVTEWHYTIVAPPGFDAPVLPKDVDQSLGPGKLTQHYDVGTNGEVTAVWRFDSGKARYSPAELKALQQAVHTLTNANAVLISFPQKGSVLLAQGKAREALAAYADLVKLHPSEAIHHIQIANALLGAGFGEEARKEARHATELDAKNALGWSALAWIDEHDAIGRRFGKGFEMSAAIAAYRTAIDLDPKEWSNYADLAILLEHDDVGERYSAEAKLNDAAAEYQTLKQLNQEKGESYNDNLLYVLFYAHKWDDVLQLTNSLPASTIRHSIALAAIAARDGSQSALSEAARRESSESDRSNILVPAANLLIRLQKYPLALDLLNAAAAGQENSSALRGRIEVMHKVHPYQEALLPETDPRSVVQKFYLFLLDPRARPEEVFRYTEAYPADQKDEAEKDTHSASLLRKTMEGEDITLPVARDLILSNLQMSVEGDEQSGFRIRAAGLGDKPQTMLVARGPSGYRIEALDNDVDMVGAEVLRRLDAKDFKSAKTWLDWAREEVTLNSGDDPLYGLAFPRFWTRGDDPDPKKMRLAAMALLVNSSAIGDYIPELKSAQAQAHAQNNEAEDTKLDLLLTHAAQQVRDWNLLLEAASRLLAANPASNAALSEVVVASIFTKHWDQAQKAIAAHLARIPDDLPAIRTSAQLAEGKGDFAQARSILRPLIDNNRAEMYDFNEYTWNALFIGQVSEEDVSLLQRAIAKKSNSNFAEIHTLACLYAEIGKTKEARELLLRAMDSGGFEEPNESIWYGFGRIAEDYGLPQVALNLYERVGKTPEADFPTSTYNLARMREKLLAGAKP